MSARRWKVNLVLSAIVVLAGARTGRAQTSFLEPLKAQWENTRALVLRMAEAIPEEKYDFKPTPEVRSFRDQLTHLVGENYMFMGMVVGERPAEGSRADSLKSKDEILKALKESYDYGAKVWSGLTEQKALEMMPGRGGQQVQRWTPILANIVDNMDHYGNLVVYVRLNGMVPPRTADRPAPPQRPQR
jgi:uncharacterized damage-inducible protein DinB